MSASLQSLDDHKVWPYHLEMASHTIKSTYTLDVPTVTQLEDLAKCWRVSKSAALRRAIREAAARAAPLAEERLQALNELQRRLALDETSAATWIEDILKERLASTERRLG